MKTNKILIGLICLLSLVWVGSFVSCEKNGGETPQTATGTVVGSYANGFASLLVQVDGKYPIGKTIEYKESEICLNLPHSGTYQNIIQVQSLSEPIIEKRISFSYRSFQSEKDDTLFTVGSGLGNALCGSPNVPIYVITSYQILN
ncbi:MAG: hypothetical protein LBE82_08955 [Chitinophagaceae bacterium]|jgi:hypothetical protein|nr:hypothetical protein [Chitinophagaceae bacterium]